MDLIKISNRKISICYIVCDTCNSSTTDLISVHIVMEKNKKIMHEDFVKCDVQ